MLVQLSVIHKELQDKYQSQEKVLVEVSKMLQIEMLKDVSISEEEKTIQWIKDMYDYRPSFGRRNQLASKSKPKTTSNSRKNRLWITKTEELCIELEIMYKSKEGTLWARKSKGEAIFIVEEHFNNKRRVLNG
jgi:hypothetical protein